jgi:predicted ArsR family transcriptional regulator
VAEGDFADRVAGVAALAEPVRRDLYLFVAAQPEPVGRDQAASGVGVPRHTAKFHLDKLVEEGLLVTEFRRLTGRQGPGAGRPAKLYRRAPGEVAVSLPERRYELAGRLMAAAIDEASGAGTPVREALDRAAASFGASLGEQARAGRPARRSVDASIAGLCTALATCGYEPRADADVVTLRNCPFDALARQHTDLVCGMNLALVTAAADRLDERLASRLDPEPGRCCVVVDVS